MFFQAVSVFLLISVCNENQLAGTCLGYPPVWFSFLLVTVLLSNDVTESLLVWYVLLYGCVRKVLCS